MATLNLSTYGSSITKSYEHVVNATSPSGPAAISPTYGQWALYSVSAPLTTAFQQDAGSKESVLKLQSTGEGELQDLIDDFSDGKIQFAFAKVKDPNTTLWKSVLIGWCGEGVPERTKGYFTSHLATVSKTLQGYHVQITARSDGDLTPEAITKKVSDASGANYSGARPSQSAAKPSPNLGSKPVFTPTQSGAGGSTFDPLAASRARAGGNGTSAVDEDGWGADAPPVTRTQLEKVAPSYQPTRVDFRDLKVAPPSTTNDSESFDHGATGNPDVVKGAYQPVGKVNIAEIRKQAGNSAVDDRPTLVKGVYEPVGKVDIAAIRAKARGASNPSAGVAGQESLPPQPEAAERLTTLPKPRIASRFGGSGSAGDVKSQPMNEFGFDSASSTPTVVGAGRNFADASGKTPAQLWAEKKAQVAATGSSTAQKFDQDSQPAGWKSGYTGRSWATVQPTKLGQSMPGEASADLEAADQPSEDMATADSAAGVSAMRDRFKDTTIGASAPRAPEPPALDMSLKPNAGSGLGSVNPIPEPPVQPPRSPTPPTPPPVSMSPIRVAAPVGRDPTEDIADAHDEQIKPPPVMPTESLEQVIPAEEDLPTDEASQDPGRAFGEAAASGAVSAPAGGKTAIVQFDYEKAEDNELELKEGERVTNIDMVDADWWMGENLRGQTGLFPSNYVELIDDTAADSQRPPGAAVESAAATADGASASATTLYDYEAAEDNELSFPEGATITRVEFPDEDWWSGEHNGKTGLFPASYVKLNS